MKLVQFNGLGQPSDSDVRSGDILLLVQDNRVDVVRLELDAENEFAPMLDHATNQENLASEAYSIVLEENPECFNPERAFTLKCPEKIANLAEFGASESAT